MREIRTSGATRGEVALRVLPYSTVETKCQLDAMFSTRGLHLPVGSSIFCESRATGRGTCGRMFRGPG